ncbi:hypothetical protein D3C81_1910320 [compost metagenome]
MVQRRTRLDGASGRLHLGHARLGRHVDKFRNRRRCQDAEDHDDDDQFDQGKTCLGAAFHTT